MTFHSFKKGQRCKQCAIQKQKLDYNTVKKYFSNEGCELLEENYVDNSTKMKFKCRCGNIGKISLGNFQTTKRCKPCGLQVHKDAKKLPIEFVKEEFKKRECELLEENYINCMTKMRYSCKCNNISYIRYTDFKKGQNCKNCQKQKTIDTCLEKYGVESVNQVAEISQKASESGKKYKEYTLPSGKIIKLQGYENLALDILLKYYNENKIQSDRTDMPKIMFEFNKKTKRYFPDIFIKSENKIIEVKSTWTYKKELIKNIHKALATRKLGYTFEIWIFDGKGNLNII